MVLVIPLGLNLQCSTIKGPQKSSLSVPDGEGALGFLRPNFVRLFEV